MKRYLAMIVAGLLFACCLGLAACGGSSGSASASASSASESASSASAESSAASADASESASVESASAEASEAASAEASASAVAAESDEVDPEFKDFCDRYVAACDEVVAVADKAKEAGSYEAVEEEWKAASALIDELTDESMEWATKYSNDELSDADKAYYNKVLLPSASKAASAASSMLDLIEI